MSAENLSKYWHCEQDGTRLSEFRPPGFTETSGEFQISRKAMETSVRNAIVLRKLGEDQFDAVMKLGALMLEENPEMSSIPFISLVCQNCGVRSVAPKLDRVVSDKASYQKTKKIIGRITRQAERKRSATRAKVEGGSWLSVLYRIWWARYLAVILIMITALLAMYLGM